MIRLFVEDELAAGRDVTLSADHAHYLVNVMRPAVQKAAAAALG